MHASYSIYASTQWRCSPPGRWFVDGQRFCVQRRWKSANERQPSRRCKTIAAVEVLADLWPTLERTESPLASSSIVQNSRKACSESTHIAFSMVILDAVRATGQELKSKQLTDLQYLDMVVLPLQSWTIHQYINEVLGHIRIAKSFHWLWSVNVSKTFSTQARRTCTCSKCTPATNA